MLHLLTRWFYPIMVLLTCIGCGTKDSPSTPKKGQEDPTVSSNKDTTAVKLNHAPVVGAISYSLARGTSKAVTAVVSDADGDALTLTVTQAPAHGSTAIVGNTITFSAFADYIGNDSFVFEVKDSKGGKSSQVASVTVSDLPGTPTGIAKSFETLTNQSLFFQLEATSIAQLSVKSGPGHGTLSGTAPFLVYTPQANYVGPDSLSFIATNSIGPSLPALITFNILPLPISARVFAGGDHTCALSQTGWLKCFGENTYGQLGVGDAVNKYVSPANKILIGSAKSVIDVSVGENHTCALLNDKTVKCFGLNYSGQLGIDKNIPIGDSTTEMGDALGKVLLPSSDRVDALAAGMSHTCALIEGGQVKCWGANGYRQLGTGLSNTSTLQNIGDATGEMGLYVSSIGFGAGKTAKALAAGVGHTCAILNDNSISCWGSNNYGQLGKTPNSGGSLPSQVALGTIPSSNPPTARTALQVVAGESHTCALLNNQRIKCWGRNNYQQLHLPTNTPNTYNASSLPEIVLGEVSTAKRLFSGANHTCALLTNDQVKCWGGDYSGQLGNGNQPLDTAISFGVNRIPMQLSAGRDHTCAVLDDASVKCWGDNSRGQLGVGNAVYWLDSPMNPIPIW